MCPTASHEHDCLSDVIGVPPWMRRAPGPLRGVSGRAPATGTRAAEPASPRCMQLTTSNDLTASCDRDVNVRELTEQSRIVMYFCPCSPLSPEDGHHSGALDLAEHRAFDFHRDDFLALNSSLLGLSSAPHKQQRAVAADLQRLLLSDPMLCLAVELHLRTFTVDETRWYCRSVVVLARSKAHLLPDTCRPEGTPTSTIAYMQAQGL